MSKQADHAPAKTSISYALPMHFFAQNGAFWRYMAQLSKMLALHF
jgi:hypothetical protein